MAESEFRRWTKEDFNKIREEVTEKLRDPGGSFDGRVDDLIKIVADHEHRIAPKGPARNIANAAKLLSDIAECLKQIEEAHEEKIKKHGHLGVPPIQYCHLGVTFYEGQSGELGDVVWDGSLSTALDFLSNDTYWDEERNWAGADTASVSYG